MGSFMLLLRIVLAVWGMWQFFKGNKKTLQDFYNWFEKKRKNLGVEFQDDHAYHIGEGGDDQGKEQWEGIAK